MEQMITGVTRNVTLSFQLAGVEEEFSAIQSITQAVQHLIVVAAIAKIAMLGIPGMGIAGGLLIGAGVLGEAFFLQGLIFPPTELSNARGK